MQEISVVVEGIGGDVLVEGTDGVGGFVVGGVVVVVFVEGIGGDVVVVLVEGTDGVGDV